MITEGTVELPAFPKTERKGPRLLVAPTLLAPKIRRKLMSHDVAPPLKGPVPPADEVMTLWKRVKHLGTLLTTEEVFDANGTSKRVTRVRRSIRM